MMESRPSQRMANWTLAALFAMNLLNYIDRFILASVLGDVQETLHIEDAKGGLLTTLFFVSYSLFSPLIGVLGDRMTRKYLLAAGVGVWSLATFASGLVESFHEMVLARSILGIGEAAYATLAPALLADLFPKEKRNRALATFYLAIPIGAAMGYALGGWINAHYEQLHFLPLIERGLESLTSRQFADGRGWRMAFFVVGLPGLFVAVSALFLPEPPRGAQDVEPGSDVGSHKLPLTWSTYQTLFRNKSYVYNTLGMAMFTFAFGGLQVWTPKYLALPLSDGSKAISLENANFGLGVAVVLSGLIGTPLGARLADWLAQKMKGAYFLLSGWSMVISIPFMLGAFLLARFGWPSNLIFAFIAIGLTLAFLNYGPTNAIITNVTPPNIRVAAFAINIFFIHFLGDIPSPFCMGAVSDLVRNSGFAPDNKISLFWGLLITVPAMALSGLFFILGARYFESDQDQVAKEMKRPSP